MSRRKSWFRLVQKLTIGVAALFFVGRGVEGAAIPAIHIGLYGGSDDLISYVANRFTSLSYDVQVLTSPSQVTASSLSNFDVLYVVSSEAGQLSGTAAVIANWVASGNGLIVEQPNVEGPVAIMPPGLNVSVFDRGYDGSSSGPNPGAGRADLCRSCSSSDRWANSGRTVWQWRQGSAFGCFTHLDHTGRSGHQSFAGCDCSWQLRLGASYFSHWEY